MNATKTATRDEKGRLLPRPDSLGKAFSVRVRKDLEPFIAEFAEAEGITATEWCRKQVEAAITKKIK